MQECQEIKQNTTKALIPKNSITLSNFCMRMALNNENTLLLLDTLFAISVYAFKNGFIQKVQLLTFNSQTSATLAFLNKKSYFISCSKCSLILWSTTLLGSYKYIKKIAEDLDSTVCIALHPIDENLLFSSSKDNKIKILSISITKQPCQQTIFVPIGRIIQLIINQEGSRLIALAESKKILVLQRNGQLWDIKHQVDVEQELHKICFINNLKFIFSSKQMVLFSHSAQTLQAYDLNEEAISCSSSESLCINECMTFYKPDTFPFFFDQNKQVLLVVGFCNINVIKFQNQDSGKLIIDNVIKYREHLQFSSIIVAFLSKDGNYLMISDLKSLKIDIFELEDVY
ncbi:unnamed protein product [Paramecium octaurelia]|uniref:Uncharacterized protein n=1 Tax=Paramecium octaurelia TaxID=43137 RepID=A0A8S1WDZ4_PAROT|nr:unnamed protein product [Paramecium octaurelia]